MALDELHARRLATLGSLCAASLDRMERILGAEGEPGVDENFRLSETQARCLRERMAAFRARLHTGLQHFSVRPERPRPQQILMAELSALWVMLENARPERLQGYGLEFESTDRSEWEKLVQGLLRDLEAIRGTVLHAKAKE